MKTLHLVFVCLTVTTLAQAAAPGRHLSGDYVMAVDGRDVDVVCVPTPESHIWNRLERQPYSYAPFTATGTVEVCVRSGFLDLSRTEILPKSKGVSAVSQAVDAVVFRMTPPMTLVLEPRGRHRALVVSANLPEADPPRAGNSHVKYFGPGYHAAGKIELGDDETLYLAPGAWVEGWLKAKGRNMTVCGSGVLSGGCWDWCKGPEGSAVLNRCGSLSLLTGENITVRDTTFFSSWGWTLVFNAVTNVLVDNVKVVCGRVINDDGIDICRGRDVVLRNSFVRCQDDCIAPKWWCENLVCTNMTLWTDAANVFRTGYECEPGESGHVYRNLLFKDIDVLHLALNKTAAEDYWANCAIYIQPAHGQAMLDTVYDDIRFYDCGPGDNFLNVKTMPITQGSAHCRTDEAGTLRGLVLRNIHLPDAQGGMGVNLSAHDDAHPIDGVVFEDVTGYGPLARTGKVGLSFGSRKAGAMAAVVVDAKIPAGNIVVDAVTEREVRLQQDLRDTDGKWFYWKFRVTGAAGRTLGFRFADCAVGARGPAVSTDRGKTWRWGDDVQPAPLDPQTKDHADIRAFDWTFGAEDDEVWFSQTLPYGPDDWQAFLARHAADRGRLFEEGTLCTSRKGNPVPYARFGRLDGQAKERLFFSSRHHCGEVTATMVLEGLVEQVFAKDELGQWLRENAEIRVVPFADLEGAVAGDQGKNRKPHDYARDYNDDRPVLYPSVRAIMKMLREWRPTAVTDIHCPWLRGNWFQKNNANEYVYQVGLADPTAAAGQKRLAEILERVQRAGLGYRASDDFWFGRGWNSGANYTQGKTMVQWSAGALHDLKLTTSWEIPFANARFKTLYPADFRAFGRDLAQAYRDYLVLTDLQSK